MHDQIAGTLRETEDGYFLNYHSQYLSSSDAQPISQSVVVPGVQPKLSLHLKNFSVLHLDNAEVTLSPACTLIHNSFAGEINKGLLESLIMERSERLGLA